MSKYKKKISIYLRFFLVKIISCYAFYIGRNCIRNHCAELQINRTIYISNYPCLRQDIHCRRKKNWREGKPLRREERRHLVQDTELDLQQSMVNKIQGTMIDQIEDMQLHVEI